MKASLVFLGSFAVLIAIGPPAALADPPPASFEIDFAGEAAIWNPFEGFIACEDLGGVTGCLELHNVVCDGRGSCSCDAEFNFSGALEGSLTGPCTAKTRCNASGDPSKPVCNASLRVDTTGVITGPGVTCDGEIDVSVKGPVEASGLYDGRGNGKVALDCSNGQKASEPVKGAFPYDVNPPTPWTLRAQIAQDGRKLEGTATDSLGFSYTAKGSYNEKKDESKLSFSGAKGSASNGAKVALKSLVTTGSSITGGSAKISVQGNKSTVEIGP